MHKVVLVLSFLRSTPARVTFQDHFPHFVYLLGVTLWVAYVTFAQSTGSFGLHLVFTHDRFPRQFPEICLLSPLLRNQGLIFLSAQTRKKGQSITFRVIKSFHRPPPPPEW